MAKAALSQPERWALAALLATEWRDSHELPASERRMRAIADAGCRTGAVRLLDDARWTRLWRLLEQLMPLSPLCPDGRSRYAGVGRGEAMELAAAWANTPETPEPGPDAIDRSPRRSPRSRSNRSKRPPTKAPTKDRRRGEEDCP